jgi:hypothetical protein
MCNSIHRRARPREVKGQQVGVPFPLSAEASVANETQTRTLPSTCARNVNRSRVVAASARVLWYIRMLKPRLHVD